MKNIERFKNATQFLAGYFHQDWGEVFEEPEEAVAQFIKDADRQTRADTLRDLRQIVAEFPEKELGGVMLSICCYYSPERYRGMSMRAWLDELIAELGQSLSN